MPTSIEAFLKDRIYLRNISPASAEWYRQCLKWLPTEQPTQAELNDVLIRMREAGKTPAGCNCTGRAINAYLKWSGSVHKVPKLREPVKLPATFTERQIKLLVTFKPRSTYQRRLHVLILILLDTGCRLSEVTGLKVCDVDMDNLLVKVTGKGSKDRLVPISFELRKAIFRHVSKEGLRPDARLVATGRGLTLSKRNVLRDVKALCRTLGFDPPARTVHALRHTFACNYARHGSVFHLQKVLGHASLEVTRRYANLVTSDLSAVHERVSLLNTR